MKWFQSFSNVKYSFPDLSLFYSATTFLMSFYHFQEISTTCVLHNNAQISWIWVKKSLFKPYNIFTIEWSKNSDLIDCVVFFLFAKSCHSDLFECINLMIELSFYLINLPKCTLTKFFNDLKVLNSSILHFYMENRVFIK